RSSAASPSRRSIWSRNVAANPATTGRRPRPPHRRPRAASGRRRTSGRLKAVALSVAESLALVLADAAPLPREEAALVDACGRGLAADLQALRPQPPAAVSAMDGYAVRAADVVTAPTHLTVVGEVAAGRVLDRAIGLGETARIFTGGVMPPGADTVVI